MIQFCALKMKKIFFYDINYKMSEQVNIRVTEAFWKSPLGKLYGYLQPIKEQDGASKRIVTWSSDTSITITNMDEFNQNIYAVPYSLFRFTYFAQYKFKLMQNYTMIHQFLSRSSSQQEWVKLWLEMTTQQFFNTDSNLLNLFLLLELSKMQQKMETNEPPSPVSWLTCGKQIEFNDMKAYNAFQHQRRDRFRRKLNGFQSLSKYTMMHSFLRKNSPVEMWVAAFSQAKILQIQRSFSRVYNQNDMKHLKRRLRQMKQQNFDKEQILQLEFELNRRKKALEKSGNSKDSDIWKVIADRENKQNSISNTRNPKMMGDFLTVIKKSEEDSPLQNIVPKQESIYKATKRFFQKPDVNKLDSWNKSHFFKTRKPTIIPAFESEAYEMREPPRMIRKQVSYEEVKSKIIEATQKLQDSIVKIGSKNIQLYKSLLPTYKCSSSFLTEIEKFEYNYQIQKKTVHIIDQTKPKSSKRK